MAVGHDEHRSTTRILMSPPNHLDSLHLFNPWMHWSEAIDRKRAVRQWERLRELIESAGAIVEVLEPALPATAMTFTRDTALVYGAGSVLILRNDGSRGDIEPNIVQPWFERRGYTAERMPPRYHLDGGNIVRSTTEGVYVVGVKPGSQAQGETYLVRLLRRTTGDRCLPLPLAHRKYLHLDMVMADLAGRGWLLYPQGLGAVDLADPAWDKVFKDAPIVEVTREEAEQMACNVVVIGQTVVAGALSARLRRSISRLGFDLATTDLDEFRKAGGGAHCLTLEI